MDTDTDGTSLTHPVGPVTNEDVDTSSTIYLPEEYTGEPNNFCIVDIHNVVYRCHGHRLFPDCYSSATAHIRCYGFVRFTKFAKRRLMQ